MAFATGYRARLVVILSDLSMATCTHSVVCLLQVAFRRVQIRLKPEADLILVASRTLDTFGTFIKLHFVYNVFSIFEPMVTIAAFDSRIIKVEQVRKINRRPAAIGKYRLVIQQNIFWLSLEIDCPQKASYTQNQHANQKMSPSHAFLPGCDTLANDYL
jgi:hypothetical protein